jgi:DNA polymerase-3 subunit alpha
MNEASGERRNNFSGQISLMGEDDAGDTLPPVAEFAQSELLAMEKEVMGIFVSGHPLDSYKTRIAQNSDTPINNILLSFSEERGGGELTDGQMVRIAGIITKKTRKYTRRDDEMAFLTVEDLSGAIEVVVFPKLLARFDDLLCDAAVVSIAGRINAKEDDAPKLILEAALPIDTAAPTDRLYVKIPAGAEDGIPQLKELLKIFGGDVPVFLYFEKEKKTVAAPKTYWVTPSERLYAEIKKIMGDGCETVLKKIT